MSHGTVREDPQCLNCGELVQERFCSHCGQENTEPRQSFHYLFTHFFEDFTHYDGQFWKTLRYLFFRPGEIVRVYLSGKRKQFVPPVKLYIFVSFITFFLPTILPSAKKDQRKPGGNSSGTYEGLAEEDISELEKLELLSAKDAQLIRDQIRIRADTSLTPEQRQAATTDLDFMGEGFSFLDARNKTEYDSLAMQKKDASYLFFKPIAYKIFELKESGYSSKQVKDSFVYAFVHAVPKALFLYLPVFAFFLWLFHNKKKWLYFDHGVFTLYYFSFLLLAILTWIVLGNMADLAGWKWLDFVKGLFGITAFLYSGIYFYLAHHKVYQTSKGQTIGLGIALFLINSLLIIILLFGLLYMSFLMIH